MEGGNSGRLIGLAVGLVIFVVFLYFFKLSQWRKKQQAGEFSAKPKVTEIFKSLFAPKK